MSLFWRVYASNAGLLVLAAVVLGLTPITVSWPIELTETVVLLSGLAMMLLANAALLRPTFAPLERLARSMGQVDLLRPGQRANVTGVGEVASLIAAFNRMLSRLEEERRTSDRRAIAAQEAERKRVATELHDEVGQSMTAVLMLLPESGTVTSPTQRERLDAAREAVRGSLEEVRRIAAELRPQMLEHLGLSSALAALLGTFADRSAIRVERRIDPTLPALTDEAELMIYRIVQEGLTNVARHAAARSVRLDAFAHDSELVVRLTDDGRGIPAGVLAAPRGGLQGMRERAVAAGAELTVCSAAGRGTELRLRVPVPT